MPVEKMKLKATGRFFSLASWATAGERLTAHAAVTIPAAKASASKAEAGVTHARKAARQATETKQTASVLRRPKRRMDSAATREPTMLPAVIALVTRPRKSSRNPSWSRYRL